MSVNSHEFADVYEALGIRIPDLGCIMLEVDIVGVDALRQMVPEIALYASTNPDRWWIDGFVALEAHVTLLYGLLEQGPVWRSLVDRVLEGWDSGPLEIESFGMFPSPYPDEPYACIVGHVAVTPKLREAHARLSLLPHVNTYDEYRPHVTIAYVRADVAPQVLARLESLVMQRRLIVGELDYGGTPV